MSHQIGGRGSSICDRVWPGGGRVIQNCDVPFFTNKFFLPAFIYIELNMKKYHWRKSFIWHVNFFVCLKFSVPILLWKILYITMKLRIFEPKGYWWIFMYRRYFIFCTMKLWKNITKNKNVNFISIFFGFFGGRGVNELWRHKGGVNFCDTLWHRGGEGVKNGHF